MIIPITPLVAPMPAAVAKNGTNCWQINLAEAAGITRKPLTNTIPTIRIVMAIVIAKSTVKK